jgi:ATP-dependent RNA helicase DeaD
VRINKFTQRISDTLAVGDLGLFQKLIEQYESEHDVPALEIAAALARIAQGGQPLLLTPPAKHEKYAPATREGSPHEATPRERAGSERRSPPRRDVGATGAPHPRAPRESTEPERAPSREFTQRPLRAHATEAGKRTYRIEVGHEHGVKPGNIVGAIANEAGLDSQFIGRLSIRDHYSLIDLPEGMPSEIFQHLQKVWVVQQQLRIHEWDGKEGDGDTPDRSPLPPRKPGGHPGARAGGFKPRAGGLKPPRRK